MKQVFLALVAKDPLPIARYGYPSRTTPNIPQFQDREFCRRIHCDINGQLGMDAILSMFKHAIAEAMADDVRRRSRGRQRGWRPKISTLLITEVKGFSGDVRHRIVVPRRQTKLVRVSRPGVAAAALR